MPRKITGSAFLSLDGIMQAPGGPTEDPTGGFDEGGWVFKMWDEGIEPTLGKLFGGSYDLLLGRRTYDIFAAYWPYAEGDNAPMGRAFDAATKFVMTRGQQELPWENSRRVPDLAELERIRQSEGPDLIIQGSSGIYPALLNAGLIDELVTMTFPVLLGSGKRLLGDGICVRRMETIDHAVTSKGTVITTYRPGGALPPYPDEAPIPITSARELARQQRMSEGTW